jgi:D-alanyl-D-alanine dipeptidase
MATDGLRRSVGSAVDVTLQLAALADAGNEYLILQPSEAPDPFTIAPALRRVRSRVAQPRQRRDAVMQAHGFGHQDHN